MYYESNFGRKLQLVIGFDSSCGTQLLLATFGPIDVQKSYFIHNAIVAGEVVKRLSPSPDAPNRRTSPNSKVSSVK